MWIRSGQGARKLKDSEKTKIQLIQEIKNLRQRLATHESGHAAERDFSDRRRPRQRLETKIEFIGDFDLVQARSVDLSREGICFEVDEFLIFEMAFEVDGERRRHRAQLIWMDRHSRGRGYRMGFKFDPSESLPMI